MTNEILMQQIETAILGECLNNNKSIDKALSLGVTREDFYNSNNQEIFESMVRAYKKYGNVDVVLTVKENNKLSISYLSQIVASSISINVKAYVKELKESSIKRKFVKAAKGIVEGKEYDINAFIEDVMNEVVELNRKLDSDNAITTIDNIKITDIHRAEKVKSGFKGIDDKIMGFLMGSLNIITGYNGSGKSTIINQMCIAESLSQGYKVFAYSPELTNSNLKSWLYPTLAIEDHFVVKEYGSKKYRTIGDLAIRQIDFWIKDKLYLYTDDSLTSSAAQLLSDMEYLVKDKGVRVFIIDNLMKLDLGTSKDNELQAQKKFVNKLKIFARYHNALIHLVAHPRKPRDGGQALSKYDVAGSGDITNLADYTIGVIRIGEEEQQKAKKEGETLKDCVLKVLKDRPTGASDFLVELDYDATRRRFYQSSLDLKKDYGYTRDKEMVQVEMNNML